MLDRGFESGNSTLQEVVSEEGIYVIFFWH
jgi:hypothetical protein